MALFDFLKKKKKSTPSSFQKRLETARQQPEPSTKPVDQGAIALTDNPDLTVAESPVLQKGGTAPVTSLRRELVGGSTSPLKAVKQFAVEGIPKAVGTFASSIPEGVTKLAKADLKIVNSIVKSKKLKGIINKLQIFDDDIDVWQSSFRDVFNKKDKKTSEKIGAFLGEEVAPFFFGAGVLNKVEKVSRLGKFVNTIKSPVGRSIFRGALIDLGVQPTISLGQNETKEQFAFNLAAGLALGTTADIAITKIIQRHGRKVVQETVSEAIFESQKAITRGATAQEAEAIYKGVFEQKFGKSFFKEGRLPELKGAGQKGEDIRLKAELQAKKEADILKKADKKELRPAIVKKTSDGKFKVLEGTGRFVKSEKDLDIFLPKGTKPPKGAKLVKAGVPVDEVKRLNLISSRGKAGQAPEFIDLITKGHKEFDHFVVSKSSLEAPFVKRIKPTKPVVVKGKPVKQVVRKVTGQVKSPELKALGKKLSAKEVTSRLKKTATSIGDARKIVIQYAKENLVKDKAGNIALAKAKQVLTAVKDAKTKRTIIKAMDRIDKIVKSIERGKTISKIKETVSSTQKFPAKTQDAIDSIMKGIDVKTLSTDKGAKLVKFKQALTENPKLKQALLRKSNIDKLKELERLEKEGIAGMSDSTLENINRRLVEAVEEGEKAIAKRIEKEAFAKRTTLKGLKRESLNVDTPVPQKEIGKALSGLTKFKQKVATFKNLLKAGDFAFATPDVGFEVLDNGKKFGLNYRTYKKPVDDNFSGYQVMRNDLLDSFSKAEKRLKIKTEEQWERIAVHAMREQVGGRKKLILNGLDGKQIDEIKLTPNEKEMYNFMREDMDLLTPLIDDVLRRVYNRRLGKVDNYFSMQTDFSKGGQIVKHLEDDFLSTRTSKAFTKSRELKGKQQVRLNARDIYTNHINNASYFINMDETLGNIGKLAKSTEYGEAVGTIGQKWVNEWIDILSRKGVPKGFKPNLIDKLNNNVGAGVMAFKLFTVLKQPVAKVTSGALIGRHAFTHDLDMFIPGIRKAIHNASPQQKFRAFDDPAFQEVATKSKLTKIGFTPLQSFDAVTADSVWYGAYRKSFADRKIKFDKKGFIKGEVDKEAKGYADYVTRRTNGSAEVKDMAKITRKDADASARAIFKFQSFIMSTEAQLIRNEILRSGFKDLKVALNVITWLALSGMAERAVTSGGIGLLGTKKSQEFRKEETSVDVVADIVLGKIPIANNIYNGLKFKTSGIPLLDTFWKAARGAEKWIFPEGKKKETRDRNERKGLINAVDAGLTLLGVPGAGQAAQLVKKGLDQ